VIDYNIGFGCGVFVSKVYSPDTVASDWMNYRSFFFASNGFVQLGFGDYETMKRIIVWLKDAKINISHLRIFKGDHEEMGEEAYYNE